MTSIGIPSLNGHSSLPWRVQEPITMFQWVKYKKAGPIRNTFIGLSQETAELGKKLGIIFKEDLVQYNLKVLDKLAPESTASLQKDLEKGHNSEVQGLLFDVIQLGEEKGIDMQTYQTVAAKFK